MAKIVDVNALEQYKEDYKLYCIYVCRERVMADVRDGLKPVVRKILVSAKDLNIKSPKVVKSARIVGETMGKYHPHGDCFSHHVGVYGVDGNIYSIGDLCANNVKSLKVFALDEENNKIVEAEAHSFRIGQYATKIYKLTYSNGYSIECTGNHPFLRSDKVWVKAKDITVPFKSYSKSIDYNTDELHDNSSSIIVDITVTDLEEPEPMYDFTVDGYENMMVPITDDNNNVDLICVHNSSIYGTMKPMSNDFEIKAPLLAQSGAWGNKYGDDPAAMRYTEAGLSKFAEDTLLKDLMNYPNCIDWMNTFDNSAREPESLPASLPILLVNGSFGIGVGLKIEIPKHSLSDVIDESVKVIKDKSAPVRLIPDQCMECEIVETDFEDIGNKGYGYFTVRGIVEEGTSPTGNPTLVIKSAPDLVYYQTIDEAVGKLITSKKLVNIISTNHQDREMIIEVKKGTDLNYIKQMLYQHTDLQKNCRVSFEVLDKDGPIRMSYKAYILFWLEYRKFTKLRIYYAQLQEINTEMHKYEPYIKLAKSPKINEIIAKIRKSTGNDEYLIEYLIKELEITDLQASFIINLRLKNLTKAYLQQFIDKYAELQKEQERILDLISNDHLVEEDIIKELLDIKAKYGDKRICKVISKSEAIGIPQGEFKIIATEGNCLKKLPINDGIGSFKNDKPKFIIKGDNTQNIIIFNEQGKVFKLPIHRIGFSDKRSNGIDVRLLIKNCTSNINAIMYEPMLKSFMDKMSKYFIVTLTANGFIKKMDIDDFLSANNSGLIYAKLDEGDYIKDIMVINHKSDVIVYTASKALRFSMEEVPYLKRSTKGNKAINSNDPILGLSVVLSDTTDIVVVTKKGYINRIPVVGFAPSSRAKAPNRVIKLGKGDYIVGLYGLNEKDSLDITTTENKISINVADIPIGSSVSTGIKMIKTRTEEIVQCLYQKAAK